MGHTYLVTGANRGLGLEFARQIAARGSGNVVIGTARNVSSAAALAEVATVVPLDVSNAASIDRLPDHLGQPEDSGIDVLINNAGVGSRDTKALMDLTAQGLQSALMVNAVAPMLVTRALLPRLRRGTRKLIINITSQLGSIANNTGGSSYGYRASKAALNMLTVCMSNELRGEGFTCVAMHPGWVRTDMGGDQAPLSVQESITMMLRTLDQLGPADSGRFLNYDGTGLPW